MNAKVRKIGNSVGVILPKETGVIEGDELKIQFTDQGILLGFEEANKAHDRAMIEEAFADFEKGNLVTEEQMIARFGKYGWGKDD
ncbi:MAG: AbrB family transcriptional regulator [Streptococcaceae bacterium]|jgi:antitoxin component of MazEF toxin-antitoxin module|nr:AbrB family transcriptional regulator [Streptococcaceae bacterium]